MTGSGIALAAWSYGLVAVAYLGFGLRLMQIGYLRKPRDRSAVTLLLAIACSAAWGCLVLADLVFDQPLVRAGAAAADLGRYGLWFAFLLLLIRPGKKDGVPGEMAWLGPAAIAVVGFGFAALAFSFFDVRFFGEPARLVLFASMAAPLFALILVEQLFANVSEDVRWNVKPLCLGLVGGCLFDLYMYSQAVLFNRPDPDALAIRGAVHALVVPLLLLSTSRRSDWISKIQVSRKAAFHSATLLLAGVYLIFISGVGYYIRYFGGEWGRALQLGTIYLSLVFLMVLALSGSVRAKLRVFLGKHFFRYRYDYREEWLRFTQTLSDRSSPQEMEQQVIRGLADMLESPAGGLWTRGKSDASFSQTARWNWPQTQEKEAAGSALCQFMTGSGWVINLEEYRSFPRRYAQLVLPRWLQELNHAWLIVPLTVGQDLFGFVVLASARTRVDVNWEVNDLLKTAGRQAASFLAQMQATEALLEVRKFDAFNRMSAFVVHDLKNIVTQLSLMMKNAKRLHDNPEFQKDMLMTVENSLDRMRQLMLQLREGATPAGTAYGVDLGVIVRRLESTAAGRGRKIETELVEHLTTRGHGDRLERVIGHVVQNALDATDPAGRVWLKIDRAGSQARIEVGDTGSGMSEEFIRDRLFKPFQTTKQAGMGIGAYESFQYVKELGGAIAVDSKPGAGTKVTVLLPMFEVSKSSDLHMLEAS